MIFLTPYTKTLILFLALYSLPTEGNHPGPEDDENPDTQQHPPRRPNQAIFNSGARQSKVNLEIVGDHVEDGDKVVTLEIQFEQEVELEAEEEEEHVETEEEIAKREEEEAGKLRISGLLKSAKDLRSEDGDIEASLNLYREAAFVENSSDAYNALGEIYLRGEFGSEINYTIALNYFNKSAEFGNEDAQHNLAFLYASGIEVHVDPAMSILYDYFSSTGSSYEAQMSLGYRHLNGYGVPQSCQTAVKYYQSAAKHAVGALDKTMMSGVDMVRLADESQRNAPTAESQDVIQYIKQTADSGDQYAQFQMGRLQYYGARGVPENPEQAARYFQAAADQGHVQAMGQLGHLYVQGRGVKQDNETALEWFTIAAEKGDAAAKNGLGFLQLHGLGTKKDLKAALLNFKQAAEQGNRDAQYHYAGMHYEGLGMDVPDYETALRYYAEASRAGHTPALYHVATMHLLGRGTLKSCHMAVKLFKTVAQRGPWADVMAEAHQSYLRGDYEQAIILYARMGEEGYEIAQHNAGWLLDQSDSYFEGDSKEVAFRYFSLAADQGNADAQRILGDYHYYNLIPERAILAHRSDDIQKLTAEQDQKDTDESSSESMTPDAGRKATETSDTTPDASAQSRESTKSGTGKTEGGELPLESDSKDGGDGDYLETFARAARHYQLASDANNAQAMFNLGYMHQFGIGLPQDLHLAKRFYDQTLEENAEAYVPVIMALVGLRLHSFYLDIIVLYIWDVEDMDAPDGRSYITGFLDWLSQYETIENIVLSFACFCLCGIIIIRLRRDQGFWH